jgi:predicted RNase H-like HicB family nuclease
MARYIAVIDHEEGQFGAYFPDAPGCTAMGATEEEVIDNAIEALAEWAADVRDAGQEVPRSRSYLQLLKSGEYGLGQGGMIATIPLLIETGTVARANISLDAGLLAGIDEAAGRAGLTRSSFLASAAREKIKAST